MKTLCKFLVSFLEPSVPSPDVLDAIRMDARYAEQMDLAFRAHVERLSKVGMQ